MAGISAKDLQQSLRGADYPASKDQLIDLAENNNADASVIDALRDMPDGMFEDAQDVGRSLSDTN